MEKTKIEGWSLSKHSDFIRRIKAPKRFIRQRKTTVRARLSEALKYYVYKDQYGHFNNEMIKVMGTEDDWYKYNEKDF